MASTHLSSNDLETQGRHVTSTLLGRDALLLRSATLADGRVVDISIDGGVITQIDLPGTAPLERAVEDLSGYVVLPSFVEPHVHLDKALTSDVVVNRTGSLEGAIASWMPARVHFQSSDIAARARRAVERYLANAFGDRLSEVREAMATLAARYEPAELNRIGFRLYEMFRPEIPPGNAGWGARAALEVGKILSAG